MDRVVVGKQVNNIESVDEFMFLVEEHMGYDSFEWLKRYIELLFQQGCNGECDKTYTIQENYEGIIHDAIDELEEIKTKDTKALEKIQKVIKKLYSEI